MTDVAHRAAAVDQTRGRILAAAHDLYATRGWRGTTTRGVAERAGVNEATLFRHFKTKEQLVTEMFERVNSRADADEHVAAARRLPTLEAQLVELAHRSVSLLRAKRDLIRVTMAEEITDSGRLATVWRGPSETFVVLREFFGELVASGRLRGDPPFLTRLFMSQLFAYVVCTKLWDDCPHPETAAIERIVDHFLNGARA